MQQGEDTEAATEVFLRVLDELHKVAKGFFKGENPGHTLQATAVVHELWLKIADRPDLSFNNEQAFMAYASRAFRHVLIDHARRKNTDRRGGGRRRSHSVIDLEAPCIGPELAIEVAELLELFETEDPRAARVVEMRFFGGMTEQEIAGVLGVCTRTVRKDWAYARAWMAEGLGEADPTDPE